MTVTAPADDWARPRPPSMCPEVAILGASNVTKNLGVFTTTIRRAFPDGVRMFIAHGHGRSYGVKSRALARQLDGHVDSAFWPAWQNHSNPGASRYALITDVGNDLLFGPRVDDILGWVGQCIARFKGDGCEIAVATLPVEAITRLSSWRYQATSRLFFPKHAVSWDDMQRNVHDLDEGLRVLARGTGASIIEPDLRWYGFDPIHFRMRNRFEAVTSLLSGWKTAPQFSAESGGFGEALRLWTSRPARKWVAGRRIDTPQPIDSDDKHQLWLF